MSLGGYYFCGIYFWLCSHWFTAIEILDITWSYRGICPKYVQIYFDILFDICSISWQNLAKFAGHIGLSKSEMYTTKELSTKSNLSINMSSYYTPTSSIDMSNHRMSNNMTSNDIFLAGWFFYNQTYVKKYHITSNMSKRSKLLSICQSICQIQQKYKANRIIFIIAIKR